MSGSWADFPSFTALDTGAETVATQYQPPPADSIIFPEWDKGRFRKPRLPTALIIGVDTGLYPASDLVPNSHRLANEALWKFLHSHKWPAREDGMVVCQYFSERPDLMERLSRIRAGKGRLTDRLSKEFKGNFHPSEVCKIALLIPLEAGRVTTAVQDNFWMPVNARHAKAKQRARQKEEQAREKAARREEELLSRFKVLISSGNPELIVDAALENKLIEKWLGSAISKVITSTHLEEPPDLLWKAQPGTLELPDGLCQAVANVCMERWKVGRKARLLAEKRSASSLKAAETRRIRTAAKREVEQAEAKVKAAADRLAALPRALAARERGADTLVEMLAIDSIARSLLVQMAGEDAPLLTLTDSEIEAEKIRKQKLSDDEGIWRKDIHKICPWIKDSEIEVLLKQKHLKVLRTVEIKKNGRYINARLYDPVSVRLCTRQWIENWRASRKSRIS